MYSSTETDPNGNFTYKVEEKETPVKASRKLWGCVRRALETRLRANGICRKPCPNGTPLVNAASDGGRRRNRRNLAVYDRYLPSARDVQTQQDYQIRHISHNPSIDKVSMLLSW